MATQVRELVVFIASPGDLDEERNTVRSIAELINQSFENSGLRVRAVGWELTTPGFGRPQAQINPMVDHCDVFIGLLNRRWGSNTGEFSSGFEEEFEIALQRRTTGRAPTIGMFFKKLAPELISDAGPQLSRVLEFKARIQSERIALYKEFHNADHLSTLILAFLTANVLPLALDANTPVAAPGTAGVVEIGGGETRDTSSHNSRTADAEPSELPASLQQLSTTFKAFNALITEESTAGPLDVDRLALFARSFEPNPEPIGTHLVNRLYLRRKQIHLTNPEEKLWWRTFLADLGSSAHMKDRTVPSWGICATKNPPDLDLDQRLTSFACDHDVRVARGAVRLLTRLKRKPTELWPKISASDETESSAALSETAVIRNSADLWIDVFTKLPGVNAALNYMALNAEPSDRVLLNTIAVHEKLDESTRAALTSLVATLDNDMSPLADIAPSQYSQDCEGIISLLLERFEEVSDESTRRLISAGKPSSIRRLAAARLIMTAEADEQWLKVALEWEDLEIKNLLYSRASKDPSFGEAALAIISKESSKYPDENEAHLLAALRTPDELKAMCEASPLSVQAWQALSILRGAEMLEEARQMLDTDAHSVKTRVANVMPDPALQNFLGAKYKAIASKIIGDSGTLAAEDAIRLAHEVEKQHLVSRVPALLALSKVVTLDSLLAVDGVLTTLDGYGLTENAPELMRGGLAQILFKRWRISEVPTLREAAKAWFYSQSSRSESELQSALYDADATTRMTAVMALTGRLSLEGVERLVEDYPNREGTHWYNVVVALDEWLYAPKQVVQDKPLGEAFRGSE